jgi:amino acid transporter
MQNTRFNRFFDDVLNQTTRWLRNPWRRLSCLIIGLLSGHFLALVTSTTAGQTAEIDVVVAVVLVLLMEVISWIVYRRRSPQMMPVSRPYWFLDILNATKIGFIYGMFVQAQLLGS